MVNPVLEESLGIDLGAFSEVELSAARQATHAFEVRERGAAQSDEDPCEEGDGGDEASDAVEPGDEAAELEAGTSTDDASSDPDDAGSVDPSSAETSGQTSDDGYDDDDCEEDDDEDAVDEDVGEETASTD